MEMERAVLQERAGGGRSLGGLEMCRVPIGGIIPR
jgi:hypothetical protein